MPHDPTNFRDNIISAGLNFSAGRATVVMDELRIGFCGLRTGMVFLQLCLRSCCQIDRTCELRVRLFEGEEERRTPLASRISFCIMGPNVERVVVIQGPLWKGNFIPQHTSILRSYA